MNRLVKFIKETYQEITPGVFFVGIVYNKARILILYDEDINIKILDKFIYVSSKGSYIRVPHISTGSHMRVYIT